MSRTALAAVFRSVSEPLSLESFPVPEPAGTEVLVRIACSTICGSDLHSRFGRRACPTPTILGHEMVGEIAALGPAGARDFTGAALAVGDRVTWSVVWSCGTCPNCLRGLHPKCDRLMKFGHEKIAADRALLGGMAEYCLLPQGTAVFRVPANVPDVVASPANCATATVAAVLRAAGPVEGRRVIVLGAGMLGLTACAMAAHRGASSVIAIEPLPDRRETALRFGAGHSLPPDRADRTGLRADIVLELAGAPESVERGIELLTPGGRFILAGSVFPARPAQISAEQIVRLMIRMEGVHNYSPDDLRVALEFLSATVDRFPFAELVNRRFPLSAIDEAMLFAESERPPRVAVVP